MAYLDNVYAVVQIAPTGIPTYVRLSQNENGRVLNFAVSGDALPAGSTVALTGTKPDGAVYSASGTLADNVATFNEDEQLTAVAGEWDAKVEVTNSGNLIATGRIKFVIDADPSGGNIPSDSQLDGYIAEMLGLLDAGKAEAYGSPLVASTVAGMIDQSRVYVYTGSETGYTAGNWYYWNGSAWTSGGVYNAVAVNTDTTLSVAGMAADAKATGDALNGLDTRLNTAEEDITELKDDLSELSEDVYTAALAPVKLEIGVNRFLSNNAYIAVLENSARASTVPAKIPTGKKLRCVIKDGYHTTLFGRSNGTWSEIAAYNTSFTYTFTDEVSYFIQVISTAGTDIPANSRPIEVYYDIANEYLLAQNALSVGNIEIGVNRFLSNGEIIKSTGNNRASIAPFKPVSKYLTVIPDGYFNYNVFMFADGSWYNSAGDSYWNAPKTFDTSECELVALQFMEGQAGAIPEDAKVAYVFYKTPFIQSVNPSFIYDYVGEKLPEKQTLSYELFTTLSTETSDATQGATVYDKYLFVAYNNLPMISIYDMETKEHIYNITMTPVSTYHCNNINFGSEKYDQNDDFPLLYISMENVDEHKCLVYRIQESSGIFSATLVQTITYPTPSVVSMYYPNCVLDNINKLFYVIGYTQNSYVAANNNYLKICAYNMPSLSEGNVLLDIADALYTFEVRSLTATQGCFVYGGNIIQVYGLPVVDVNMYIGQISTASKRFTTLIDLNEIKLPYEPESIFMYKNNIYVLFVNRQIYKFYID